MIPTLPVLRAQLDQLDVLLAGQVGRALEAAVGEHDDPAHLLRAGEQPPRQRHGLVTRVGPSLGVDRVERRRAGCAGGRSARRRPAAAAPAAMIASSSPSRMPSISRRPSALAAASRLGATSLAFMLAELSTTSTTRRARACCQRKIGSARAKTSKRQERQLQQQREQVPQPLPERPRLLLLEDLLPEQERRDRHPPQADLEDVEDDDRHGQAGQEQRGRVDQVHASAPAARIIRSSSSSNGISVDDRVPPIP